MTLLHIENAIGRLSADPYRIRESEGPVSRLVGYARFDRRDKFHRRVLLNANGWLAEEEGQPLYKLSFDGGLEGDMKRNPFKECEYDPDYVGHLGQHDELVIAGWKRPGYILVKVRKNLDWRAYLPMA